MDPPPGQASGPPASAVGSRLTTVTVIWSTSVPPRPSSTVSWNVYVPAAAGVKDGVAVFAPVSATAGPVVWVQEYVSGSPSGSVDGVPSTATSALRNSPDWSGPAS